MTLDDPETPICNQYSLLWQAAAIAPESGVMTSERLPVNGLTQSGPACASPPSCLP